MSRWGKKLCRWNNPRCPCLGWHKSRKSEGQVTCTATAGSTRWGQLRMVDYRTTIWTKIATHRKVWTLSRHYGSFRLSWCSQLSCNKHWILTCHRQCQRLEKPACWTAIWISKSSMTTTTASIRFYQNCNWRGSTTFESKLLTRTWSRSRARLCLCL